MRSATCAFAKRLALRYRGASESFDDLLQVASLALLNAVDRFDPERGIPFTAFASPTILGELKRHFRDRAWTVRVPRGLHDRMAAGREGDHRADQEAAALALDRRDRRAARAGADRRARGARGEPQPPAALARPAAGGDDSEEATPADWIGEEDKNFELVEGRVALDAALPHLDERERLVLRLRFVDDMTQSQIAERDRPLADARLAHPAPGPGADPRAGQGAGAGELKRIAR